MPAIGKPFEDGTNQDFFTMPDGHHQGDSEYLLRVRADVFS
jgi:hypothetical protein